MKKVKQQVAVTRVSRARFGEVGRQFVHLRQMNEIMKFVRTSPESSGWKWQECIGV